ncbi:MULTISPECIES: phenylacetate--CoA ligase family protein [Micrococcaceae]|uniref:phenylacetate--CoA ligase family protein n=1 Tax=Micrococcaceae TaxID=1268 RepID=UPI00160E4576|nr:MULTISPECIES: phenylacetate--CoA ligase family protein [Micrococcaceae]MBB5748698.1 phenylacetate-coenzyme A ligase PaaK-like adenylate-forming protein [Micrococcus sp. TA1]HRO31239.1 phenylacetate--CoA ligase family protein [Citricoccus sp.]HRO94923.1 phenylacetate--CoA ligase family protein [Citricoccus sp.]
MGTPGTRVLRGRRGDTLRVWWDARRAHRQGTEALHARQRERLAELVAYARQHSTYYRRLYRGLPDPLEEVTRLPVSDKTALMRNFDEVATDPAVTREAVEAFVADPARIGERFLGQYLVATTAGTTGTRGMFVLDDRYWAATSGLMAQLTQDWLSARQVLALMVHGGRFAGVVATGGHFLSVAASTREQRERPRRHRGLRILSIHRPLPEVVAELNGFGPLLLGGYASMLRLLATEQEAGRLRVSPVLVLSTAEGLTSEERIRIGRAFGAPVREVYGCTESGYAASGCAEGWLHLLEDWVIVEPVDAEHRPVPPGVVSHTVLMTNLANRVQPVIRYDVGDRLLVSPDRCRCGNPSPAIRVQGRASDVLTFRTASGEDVIAVPPLALGTVIDRIPGVELFQVLRTTPTSLSLRLLPAPGADPVQAWASALAGLTGLLTDLGLPDVTVEQDTEPPEQGPGGKFRTVIPLAPRPPAPPADTTGDRS